MTAKPLPLASLDSFGISQLFCFMPLEFLPLKQEGRAQKGLPVKSAKEKG